MKKLVWLLVAALLCSCSQEWSKGIDSGPLASKATTSAGQVQVGAEAAVLGQTGLAGHLANTGFASAPDRGALVQYPAGGTVRRTGAYTWHAIELSEEHALRGTVTGEMNLTAPDGTPIRLAYERHVEHPDGNWSWIGRAEGVDAQATIITFGATAAFGTISQSNDKLPLRLTVADGRAWMVASDRRQLGDIRNKATHPDGPDYFIPPKLAASNPTQPAMQTAASPMVSAAAASNTVDLLVGFTGGFETARGGAAGAMTRLHNLVDITNQAYVDSQVDAEIRLVHAMKVNYPDATGNGTALEELTGFRAPSTPTTPAPAFSALRAARDQYGADLVTLVRKFSDPENDGCGVAWLVGGGRSGIAQSDEFFGYSVVSDGQDAGTDGKTYFCRETTLAHELGHNMGSQHDRDNATGDDGGLSYGAYTYSFGHKTGANAGNFYTIMAYGDTGQSEFRVFSNPTVTICGGRSCGVANQTDNARSLNQTISVVSTFRASIPVGSAARSDINGDGKSDILLRYYKTAPNNFNYWIMNGAGRVRVGSDSMGASYRIAATGDFNGDGKLDVVWAADSVRHAVMWLGTGTSWIKRSLGTYALGWTIAGAGDVDGDGKSDILLRYYKTAPGNLSWWIMDGATRVRTGSDSMGASYRIATTGDFDGDGKLDIVWVADSVRNAVMWLGTGNSWTKRSLGQYGLGWSVVGAGDINGDGKSDLLLRYYKTAPNNYNYWIMNGSSRVSQGFGSVGASYRIAATGDYDGDGRMDIIWSADSIRRLYMSTGSSTNFRLLATYGLGFSVVGN